MTTKNQIVLVASNEGFSMLDMLNIVQDARDGWIPPTLGRLGEVLRQADEGALDDLFRSLDLAFMKGITRKEQYIYNKEVHHAR